MREGRSVLDIVLENARRMQQRVSPRDRDKLEEYIRDAIPMGRFGKVDEIADAIVFLASDRSSFMNSEDKVSYEFNS